LTEGNAMGNPVGLLRCLAMRGAGTRHPQRQPSLFLLRTESVAHGSTQNRPACAAGRGRCAPSAAT
jgi:hypothetical protein